MGGIVFALRIFMETTLEMSDLVILISTVIVGVISYAGLLFVLDKYLYQEVFQLLKQLKPSPPDVVYQENCDSKEKNL
jgi:hypothetical protein